MQGTDPTAPQEITYSAFKGDVAKETDLPLYPGSKLDAAEAADANKMMSPDEKRFKVVLSTSDAPDKVAKFYEGKLEAQSGKKGDTFSLAGRTSTGNDVLMAIGAKDGKTQIQASVIVYKR